MMNSFLFSDIKIGQKAEFEVSITDKIMDSFREITGDINPLHCNKNFAVRRGFTDKVCYGLLTASFLSTLAGVYIPGERSIIHSVEVKFSLPVIVGDSLSVVGEVIEKNDTVEQIVIRVTIKNQNDLKVLRGKMKVGFLDER